MALPFNPASFVTPYTAAGMINAGKAYNDAYAQGKGVENQTRQVANSEAYLAHAKEQQSFSEKKYGQEQFDQARATLNAAMASGDADTAAQALDNLKVIGGRYGFTVSENRGSVASGMAPSGKGEVGTESNPLDVDAYDAAQKGTQANPYDADSPEFQAEAAQEVTNGSNDQVNADADQRINEALKQGSASLTQVRTPGGSLPAAAESVPEAPPQGAQASAAQPIQRPGQSLPQTAPEQAPAAPLPPLRGYTVHGPDGKPVYSVSPADVIGHQKQNVGDVFAGLLQQTQDPEEQALIKRAQSVAHGLVGTLPPAEAAKKGLELYVEGMRERNARAVTELNHKPRFGGSGGGTMLGKGSDAAESVQIYDDNATTQAGKIQEEDRQYATIGDAINSGDPSMQRDAVNQLLKIRSGSAVTASEDARIQRIDGLMPQIASMLGQWTGGDMSPEMVSTIRQIVAIKRAANAAKIERIYKHQADLYKVQNKRKVKDPSIVEERAKVLEEGGKPAPSGGKTPGQKLLED